MLASDLESEAEASRESMLTQAQERDMRFHQSRRWAVAAFFVLGTGLLLASVSTTAAQATPACRSSVVDLNSDISAAVGPVTICLSQDIIEPSSGNADTSLTLPSGANVTLQLDGHTLSITSPALSAAAINLPPGATLTIDGDGSISATGGDGSLTGAQGGGGAGIGGNGGVGGNGQSAGTLVVNGGEIVANGGGVSQGAAGIGGGGAGAVNANGGGGGAVTITGGTVTAGGSIDAAALGGGAAGNNGVGGAGGAVTISGGTVSGTGGAFMSRAGAAFGGALAATNPGTLTLDGTCSTTGGGACPPTTAGNGYIFSMAQSTGSTIHVTGRAAETFTVPFADDADVASPAHVRFIFTSTSTSTSTPTPAPSASQLSSSTVARGGTLTVTDTGFAAGESVGVYLHSTPVLLTTTTAGSSGAVSVTVTIPSSTAVGNHQLELRGARSGSFFVAFTVTAAGVNTGAVESARPSDAGWAWVALVALGGMLLLAAGALGLRARRQD